MPSIFAATGTYKYLLRLDFICVEASDKDQLGSISKAMLPLRPLLASLVCGVLSAGVAAAPTAEKAGTCSELRLFKEWFVGLSFYAVWHIIIRTFSIGVT